MAGKRTVASLDVSDEKEADRIGRGDLNGAYGHRMGWADYRREYRLRFLSAPHPK